MPLKIEPINRSHNRRSFDCGSLDLNQYLQNTARQQSEKGISRTFVLVEVDNPAQILGFFTLTACEILVEKLPLRFAKKYPMRASAAKLARLAVARTRQKQGLGTFMMLNAMERVLLIAEHMGVIGFFVDAKDEVAAGYYRHFGFIPLPDNPLELFLPIATIRKAFCVSAG
jgi:GNAT superfamily N-acetyltransferase